MDTVNSAVAYVATGKSIRKWFWKPHFLVLFLLNLKKVVTIEACLDVMINISPFSTLKVIIDTVDGWILRLIDKIAITTFLKCVETFEINIWRDKLPRGKLYYEFALLIREGKCYHVSFLNYDCRQATASIKFAKDWNGFIIHDSSLVLWCVLIVCTYVHSTLYSSLPDGKVAVFFIFCEIPLSWPLVDSFCRWVAFSFSTLHFYDVTFRFLCFTDYHRISRCCI